VLNLTKIYEIYGASQTLGCATVFFDSGGREGAKVANWSDQLLRRLFHRRYEPRKVKYGLLFALPAIIFFGMFYAYPLLQAFLLSFQSWKLIDVPRFIGLNNYRYLFTDKEFLNSILVTFYYSFGTVIPIWFLSLGLALVFNRTFRYRDAYIVAYYIPAVISLTVWSILWVLMYHPTYGLLTVVTNPLGFKYIRWLNDYRLVMPALIILSVWKGTPAYMIIFLAGLKSIPETYYEAAKIDGASSFRSFTHITLPLLRPVMLYVFVISIIVAFQVFTPAYLMTRGGPGSATRVFPIFIVDNAFNYLRMGYASAASVVLFFILLILSLAQVRLLGFGSAQD
jgi:ABC-type sugar transport system permease subunit